MKYLFLKANENGEFDIPKENCVIEDEVMHFRIPLKAKRSDWVCSIKKRLCILTQIMKRKTAWFMQFRFRKLIVPMTHLIKLLMKIIMQKGDVV